MSRSSLTLMLCDLLMDGPWLVNNAAMYAVLCSQIVVVIDWCRWFVQDALPVQEKHVW